MKRGQRVSPAATIAMIAVIIAALVAQIPVIEKESEIPNLWIMTVLGIISGTQAFFSGPVNSAADRVIVCPAICFTFAILLCWGLGPAILAQTASVVLVAWRLRRPAMESLEALAQYTLAFSAAAVVLWVGNPDPLHHHAPSAMAGDALACVLAVAAWLGAYWAGGVLIARLRGVNLRAAVHTASARPSHFLYKTSLVLLSPVLAVAAHVNIGYVPLIFVSLYAVQRMAKLSIQRYRAARLDPLTGLVNRGGLKAAFEELTGPARDPDARIALLLADLDEFKHVNDALGHEVGDQLLVAVASRMSDLDTRRGAIARLGGDEFALIAEVRDLSQAQALADELIDALSEPVSLDGLRVDVTASVGIALHSHDTEDFATLMRHADIAMYDAKQHGGAVASYAPGSHQDSLERLALLTDFRRALESADCTQIRMHYQPQVSLRTGQVEGVEALLRWRHPTYGDVPTQDLIAMAERSSVMHLLTMRVIEDVIAHVATWSANGAKLRAAINVSTRDLYRDDIVPHLAAELKRHGVNPSQIQIEITEGALLRDPNRVASTVARICGLGVAVALDDFGTGYSSLQHLRKLPISEIKIDRSFVSGMAHNHDDAAIVRSTVEMARSLGIRTVAEGVETEYTRQLLAEAGCTLAQGWLTAYPMPADELTEWLAEHARSGRPERLSETVASQPPRL
jgi:diguanylate cyclase